jgi:hypothetical protein
MITVTNPSVWGVCDQRCSSTPITRTAQPGGVGGHVRLRGVNGDGVDGVPRQNQFTPTTATVTVTVTVTRSSMSRRM